MGKWISIARERRDMDKTSRICIVGDKGTLGNAIRKQIVQEGFDNILSCDLPEVDCTSQQAVNAFFAENKPEYVFFLAAISAGIEYKKEVSGRNSSEESADGDQYHIFQPQIRLQKAAECLQCAAVSQFSTDAPQGGVCHPDQSE